MITSSILTQPEEFAVKNEPIASFRDYSLVKSSINKGKKGHEYRYQLADELYDYALKNDKAIVTVEDLVIFTHHYRTLLFFKEREEILRCYSLTIGAMYKPLDRKFNNNEDGIVYVQSMQDFKNEIDKWRFRKKIPGKARCAFFDGKVMMFAELKMVVDRNLGEETVVFDVQKNGC